MIEIGKGILVIVVMIEVGKVEINRWKENL